MHIKRNGYICCVQLHSQECVRSLYTLLVFLSKPWSRVDPLASWVHVSNFYVSSAFPLPCRLSSTLPTHALARSALENGTCTGVQPTDKFRWKGQKHVRTRMAYFSIGAGVSGNWYSNCPTLGRLVGGWHVFCVAASLLGFRFGLCSVGLS